mmetsp:Transcript_27560/g.64610  ORF Transcript_27560/g.64610 Transcript_27560/m.64610 type:complete len:236 (-) Transcript_27560:1527-2234(-)
MSDRLPAVFTDVSRAEIEKLSALDTLLKLSNKKQRLLDSISFPNYATSGSHAHLLGSSQQFLSGHLPLPPLIHSGLGRSTSPVSMSSAAVAANLLHSPDVAAAAAAARMGNLLLSRNIMNSVPDLGSSTLSLNAEIPIRSRSSSLVLRGEMRPSLSSTFLPSNTDTNISFLGSPSSCKLQKKEKAKVAQPEIRTEKVKAALLSQHQRGKKREDLNDMERVELARTRNREHAKSTR